MAKPGETFYLDARGIKASGVITETGFKVFKGSEVRPTIAKYLAKALVDLRRQHETDGTIEDWKLTRDLDFDSPSVYR